MASPPTDLEPSDVATLIAVYNSDGCVGRCDARCYNAQSDHCDCICGGMNHGAGIERALENNSERFDPAGALQDFAKRNGFDARELVVDHHGDLFPFGNEPTTAEIKRATRRRRREETQRQPT